MKKCLFILLPLLLCCFYGKSQVTLSETFDGTPFPPNGWLNVLVASQSSGSSIALSQVSGGTNPTQSPYAGSGELKLNSYDADGGSRALITAPFDLSSRGTNTPTVSFWLYRDAAWQTDPDRVEVYMNTTPSLTGATLLGTAIRPTGSAPVVSTVGWYQYTYNMPSSFNGSINYVIFHCISDYGSNMFVDEIQYVSYPTACSGTPTPGNSLSSIAFACPSKSFTLSNQNIITASGITFQWQSSSNGTTFSNITSATSPTLTTTESTSTYYRCQVSCGSTNVGTSTPVYVPYFTACYCIPSSTNCGLDDRIDSVKISTLSNGSGCTSGGYTDYSTTIAAPELNIGSTPGMRVRVGPGGTEYVGVWIDYDHDGSFESSEFTALGSGNGSTVVGSLNSIPSTALLGNTMMRVRVRYNVALTGTDECASYTYGETEDYMVNIVCKVSVATHPSGVTTCAGSNVSFTAAGNGYSPTYQWEVNTGSGYTAITNGGVYSGATTATLSITGVTSTMGGYQYRCVVGTACGTATANTNGATLTLAPPPSITGQPANTPVCAGGNTSFTATATGPVGLTYQWQVNTGSGFNNITNGGVYSGATTGTLNITGATNAMNGYQYRFVASACNQPTNSNAATLTVNSLPAITAHPSSTTACPGGVATFTGGGSGTGVTYQWQLNTGSGLTNITNGGIYSGATTTTLTINGVSAAMTGYLYTLKVSGTCAPAVNTNYGTLTVSSAAVISLQPVNTTVCQNVGTTITMYSPNAGATYQWQVDNGTGFVNVSNGALYSGATTRTLSISSATLGMDGYRYRCQLSTPCTASPVNTNTIRLTVNASPVLTSQPSSVSQCEGINTSFGVTATGYNLSYVWQYNSGSGWNNVPNGAPYSGQHNNTLSVVAPNVSLNGYQYRCVVSGGCSPSVTSNTATLNLSGKPRVTTQPVNRVICSGNSTTFNVVATGTALTYQWQYSTGTVWTNVTNAGVYTGATTATLSLGAPPVSMNGTNYRCIINGTCSPAAGTNIVTLYINTIATIGSQPIDKTICAGGTTSFSIASSASGATPATYQWEVDNGTGFTALSNGAPYSGVKTQVLKITAGAIALNNNVYRCVVTTPCGVTISDGAVLTVNSLPVIQNQPTNVTVCPGIAANFTTAATGTGLYYEWQVDTGTGYSPIAASANYLGTNSSVLTVISTPSMNNYMFRCRVSGTCTPAVNSAAARLTVLRPVDILSHTITDTICEGGNAKLGVHVSGTALRYQWQVQASSGQFTNLNNIPPYSGVNTDSLRITEAPDSMNGKVYRCAISENVVCNNTFFTDSIPVTISLAPPVTPATLTLGFFSTATFNVTPDGTFYQWQENRNDGGGYRNLVENATYAGVKTNTLTIQPISYQMSGYQYRCIVDGICEQASISKPGTLIVDAALAVSNVAKNGTLTMNVFPNPLSGSQLNIRFDKSLNGKTEVRVLDKIGKLVYSGTLQMNSLNTAAIELQHLAAGTYMLQVVNDTEKINQSVQFTKQ